MKVNASIFRDYDIRGIAGKEFSAKALEEYEKWYGKFPGITITPEVAVAIGKAYGTMIVKRGGKKVFVGYEARAYGEELKDQFVEGVVSTGCAVLDGGVALTPMAYFATAFYDLDGGVSVTGSHNVYFFNGFKMMAKGVYPIFGQLLQEMRKLIEREDFVVGNRGTVEKKEVFPDYRDYFLKHNHVSRKLKVVVDSGNGTAGVYAPGLLRDLGCEVVEMYSEPDASFPNHVPDPEDRFVMQDLAKKVLEEEADVGVAFDADGDRFGAVDENGEFIIADRSLLVLARDVLSRNPGKKVVYDVKCTRLMETLIPKFGGIPVIHKTGHAPIKQTIRDDSEVIFAGECSGHFYHVEDYFKIDDGIYSAGKMLTILANTSGTFSQLFADFPETVMTDEMKLPCPDEIKNKVVAEISEHFRNEFKTINVDGVRVVFSDTSWGLVRASNTAPYLTIRVEADTKEEVLKIKGLLADQLEKHPEVGDKLDRVNVTSRTGKLGWV